MTKQFWLGGAVAAALGLAGFGWQVAAAQDAPAQAVCMRASMTWAKPAANTEEFMNEQIALGRSRFVSLAIGGDAPGVMCAW